MGLCETCKHWEIFGAFSSYLSKDMGKCKRIVMQWDTSEWDENGSRTRKPEYKDVKAFVQDASDYYAELQSHKTFGCVMHEEKNYATKPNQDLCGND